MRKKEKKTQSMRKRKDYPHSLTYFLQHFVGRSQNRLVSQFMIVLD